MPQLQLDILNPLAADAPLVQAQGFNDYVFGSLAPDNVQAPFEWITDGLAPVDLRPGQDRVENQGSYGMCVGEGTTTCGELFLTCRGEPMTELAPLFIYTMSRLRAAFGKPITDTGTSVFTAFSVLTDTGVCREELWPQTIPVNDIPNDAAKADALNRLVGRYERVGRDTYNLITGQSIHRDMDADIKVALSMGLPVVFGIALNANFYKISGPIETHPAQGGPCYSWQPGCIGGHCMVIIGWKAMPDGSILYIVENSWGPNWGDGGFWGISSADIKKYCWDLFVMRSFCGVDGGEPPMELRRWTADCQLRDGRFVTVDVEGGPGQVYRLYQAAFCRVPDEVGFGYWISQVKSGNASVANIADTFASSSEFHSLYGPAISNTDFVKQLYRNVLLREGDDGGVQFWAGHLDAGRLTRANVLMQFSESPENKNGPSKAANNGMFYR